MSVLLITYTLNNKSKDYTPLFNAIKNNCEYWWHYFDHTWIVSTARNNASSYATLLYPHIETSDHLLVAKITAEHQGWLPKDAWDWLNQRNFS